jgi:hypothetical protein
MGVEILTDWLAWKARALNNIQGILEETSAPVVLLTRAVQINTEGYLEDQFLNQKSLFLSAIEKSYRDRERRCIR